MPQLGTSYHIPPGIEEITSRSYFISEPNKSLRSKISSQQLSKVGRYPAPPPQPYLLLARVTGLFKSKQSQ